MTALFAACTFLGAALLFIVEPMAAKQALPILGGSPAVWNTAMVFFQATLLAGYIAAHSIAKPGKRSGVWPGLALLAAGVLFLPVSLVDAGRLAMTPAHPVFWLSWRLALGVGFPFIALAASGPLLQRWYASGRTVRAADPYFLYSASNAGSLIGLLSYPLLIEPALTITEQSRAWSVGYLAFLAGTALCAALSRGRRLPTAPAMARIPPGPPPGHTRISARRRAEWVTLAAIPSSLMLGATQHISTDIAAVPLLWTIPLAIYLATFIVAFGRWGARTVAASSTVLAIAVAATALTMIMEVKSPLWFLVCLHLAVLAGACMMCHARIAASRPCADRLTEFYFFIGLGGVLGGALTSLVAPVVFSRVLEYPIAIGAACFLRPASPRRATDISPATGPIAPRNIARWLPVPELLGAACIVVTVCLCLPSVAPGPGRAISAVLLPALGIGAGALMRFRIGFGAAACGLLALGQLAPTLREHRLYQERTFFGVHRVTVDPTASFHALYHGATLHGMQRTDPSSASTPLTYYTASSPLHRLLGTLNTVRPPRTIAVVGLGSGALAAFGKPGQEIDFYEIDEAVVRIATDPALFTYLRDSRAATRIILGDGRLALSAAADNRYDLIILDAFSSDAVPVHLLTREAVRMYDHKLSPGGLIVFNISSRYFDLTSVIAQTARSESLAPLVASDESITATERAQGKRASRWMVVGRSEVDLGPALSDPIWLRPAPSSVRAWTDDYSNIVGVLKWGSGGKAATAVPP